VHVGAWWGDCDVKNPIPPFLQGEGGEHCEAGVSPRQVLGSPSGTFDSCRAGFASEILVPRT